MAPRKNAQSTLAEISLVHLKRCLVNLPSSLVSVLMNVNTVVFSTQHFRWFTELTTSQPVQNVVVELSYRPQAPTAASSHGTAAGAQRSAYVGWTGMPSKRRVAPV